MNTENSIRQYLQQRKEQLLFRQLSVNHNLVDFSSNDYLGLSRSALIRQQVQTEYNVNYRFQNSGATGSRLLNGNSLLHEQVEQLLANHHHAEAAVLYTSGFDANVGLISTLARPSDVIFYDELVHASIHQGMRLSGAELLSFKHNDYIDLASKMDGRNSFKNAYIVTESVFSMEGDQADLRKLVGLAEKYRAGLIVDEAHATGIFGSHGSGLCNALGIEEHCLARVYTFGKAIGGHGAVVVGKSWLKEYLINFSKNFMYTTALDTHTLLTVERAYFFIQKNKNQLFKLNYLINYFNYKAETLSGIFELCGSGPIFGIMAPGNEPCRDLAVFLQHHGLGIRPILSPTVPAGRERLRIILHSFNTTEQIDVLFSLLIGYK